MKRRAKSNAAGVELPGPVEFFAYLRDLGPEPQTEDEKLYVWGLGMRRWQGARTFDPWFQERHGMTWGTLVDRVRPFARKHLTARRRHDQLLRYYINSVNEGDEDE